MRLKKRKKAKKMRGSRYHGKAAKKHKGKGNKGGKGMAGTGKRADQKKTLVIKISKQYFGKKGFKSIKKKKIKSLNIRELNNKMARFIKKGIAKKTKEGIEISLPDYKVIGDNDVNEKLIIKAWDFSENARKRIEKAGGKCITIKKLKKEEAKNNEEK